MPRKNDPPPWVADVAPPRQRPPGDDGPGIPETEEEKQLPPVQRSAKARRKRDPRGSQQAEYGEGPVGDKVCGARKTEGTRCALAAGWGTDHVGYGPCKYHMGSTPAGKKAAAYEMGEELSAFYGAPVDTNPIEALLDEVCRTAGHVAWLQQRIARFDVPISVEEIDEKTQISRKVTAGLPPEVEGWLRIYQSERAQLVRVSKAALDAGINERLVQIAEHQGNKMAEAIETILDALELTAAQLALVPTVVPNVLRQMMAGTPRLLEGTVEETDVYGEPT